MCVQQCGRRHGRRDSRSVYFRFCNCFCLIGQFVISLAACRLAGAQSIPGSGGWDCSDPLLATTEACSGQLQQGLQPQTQFGTQGTYGATPGNAPLSLLNLLGNPNYQGNLPSTYSDTEQFSRQTAAQIAVLPPEPLTEFQKFVASTNGLVLPIYGANLFRRIPSTFAPIDMSPVPADYVIGPGDELRIRTWGQVNQQTNVRVDRSGEIYLPQVGQVHVAGLTFSELDAHLREAVGRVYHNFDLAVDVGQIRAIQVYVSGQARRPGVYTVSSLSTLVDALFASGGPSVEGSLRSIELRRAGAVVTRFDLYDLLIRGDKTKDAKLLSGDVIFIPPAGAQAAVFGSVRNQAIYELRRGETLDDILADAGGVSAVVAETRVSIERIDEHRERHAMEAAYDAPGLSMPLADGDTIRVYSIVPKYEKTVTLRGNIANPGRFGWHPSMRVSDLIPDKESLLTRNYWWRRMQLGLPAPEFEPSLGIANLCQPRDNHAVAIPRAAQQTQGGTDQTNIQTDLSCWAPNQYGNMQRQAGGQGKPGGQQEQAAGQLGLQENQSGPDQTPSPTAQQRAGSAPLAEQEGAEPDQAPLGVYQTPSGALVRLTAPEIDWDYAVIERIDPETLKTQLLPFDLGKLVLQHDPSQDLALEPGDVVSIFSQADIRVPVAEQTKLVRLEGEFVHAGVYSAEPGETLRHIVERAGGLTPNAYLYGSEFTRRSTRAVQQARIDEYVQSLALNIQRGAVQLAGSSSASAQILASSSAAQTSEQNLLDALRQIRATGRIVLAFHPNSEGLDSIPNVTLEDGDRFIVPHTPTAINVVGAVYNQNSFLFGGRSRTGTYLRLAGGANRDADRRHEFIIRADGEVVTRQMSKGAWGNDFNDQPIYPGDTIVVPEKTFKPSALYGVMNWSQMFSQLALGAASLSVIQ